MDINQAKQLVVDAGVRLVESGLIARTWGNVSCRISDTQFVITPSGRPYETLTPEEIVLVNIADLSYDGDIKPSSEKGIHASCYRLRPEVNFVIHTHQVNASIVSALGVDINYIRTSDSAIIGDEVPCAAYGLPGTSKLRKGVVEALGRSKSNAFIMAHHGAICLGETYEQAFAVAEALERVCEKYVVERCSEVTGKLTDSLASVADYVGKVFSDSSKGTAPKCTPAKSERIGGCFSISENGSKDIAVLDIKSGALVGGREVPDTADLHMAVYKKRKDVNNIIHCDKPDVIAASRAGKTLKPLLDDFAQLIGPNIRNAEFNPANTLKTSKKVVKALKGRNAVLLKDNGAICCAGDEYNTEAVEMVVDKECKTTVGASLYGKIKPINPIEARVMRLVYVQKYSKQAKK